MRMVETRDSQNCNNIMEDTLQFSKKRKTIPYMITTELDFRVKIASTVPNLGNFFDRLMLEPGFTSLFQIVLLAIHHI